MKLYRHDRGGDFLARLSEHGTFGRIPIDSIAALPWTRQDVTNRTPLALNNRLAIISDGWVGRHRSCGCSRQEARLLKADLASGSCLGSYLLQVSGFSRSSERQHEWQ